MLGTCVCERGIKIQIDEGGGGSGVCGGGGSEAVKAEGEGFIELMH